MSDFINKYPYTDLHELNLDWLINKVKSLETATGITYDDTSTLLDAENVQEAIEKLTAYIKNVELYATDFDKRINTLPLSNYTAGYTFSHVQTVNNAFLMSLITAVKLDHYIVIEMDTAAGTRYYHEILHETDTGLLLDKITLYDQTAGELIHINIYAINDDANVYVDILPLTTVSFVNSFNGRTGAVTPAQGDYTAAQVDYDNQTSGLAATNVNAAIDEIVSNTPATVVESFNSRTGAVTPTQGDYTASQVDYDNQTSGLAATNVNAAIDEIVSNTPATVVESFNSRTGAVTPAQGDYTAAQVTYNNAGSGMVATDVNAAIDELKAAQPTSVVESFKGRTGAVIPAINDYAATQVSYDNQTSGLTATNVNAAIDEIANSVIVSGVAAFNGRAGFVSPAQGDYTASQVDYDNQTSGLAATNVNAAIDEIVSNTPATVVESFNSRTGAVTPAQGDYTAAQVTYNNSGSGMVATDVNAAIDELKAAQPASLVSSFNGRNGAVTPANNDYNSGQISYDNTTSGLAATNVKAAIDELASGTGITYIRNVNLSYTTTATSTAADTIFSALYAQLVTLTNDNPAKKYKLKYISAYQARLIASDTPIYIGATSPVGVANVFMSANNVPSRLNCIGLPDGYSYISTIQITSSGATVAKFESGSVSYAPYVRNNQTITFVLEEWG